MNIAFAETAKVIKGIKPVADFLSGTVRSDVVNAKGYEKIIFMLEVNAESSAGVSAITVQATAANTTSSPTAVVFKYSSVAAGIVDGQGDLTAATTSGFSTTAGEHRIYIIEVDPRDLPDDKPFVHLAAVESVDAAVVGTLQILCLNPRYGAPNMPVALS